MTISTDKNKIDELLTRGVEHIYPSPAALRSALSSGNKLTIYLGIDPTGPTLHLGHSVPLLKLCQFQELGHQVILLVGDFTAQIGDPSGKISVRKQLTRKQVLENCKLYTKQAAAILDMKKVEVKFNSTWLAKLGLSEVLGLASEFTVQQMLERDMFQKRLAVKLICKNCNHVNFVPEKQFYIQSEIKRRSTQSKNYSWKCSSCGKDFYVDTSNRIFSQPIYLHEFLYPLMQGYDSVAMGVDIEVGGNDQTFNMLVGREMMRRESVTKLAGTQVKDKIVITMKLLTSPIGEKMGKTTSNLIALDDSAEGMYGEIMSLPDGLLSLGFELCTRVAMNEVEMIMRANPRDAKMRLAREIVALYHGKAVARKAEEQFVRTFQKHEAPEKIEEVRIMNHELGIVDLLVEAKLAGSKSEARRVVEQGGVKVDGKVVNDPNAEIKLSKQGVLVQKGKRHFVKVMSS